MRITLEPTEKYEGMEQQPTVVITTAHDDLNMEDFADMLRRAAIAWGFQPDTVIEYIPQE